MAQGKNAKTNERKQRVYKSEMIPSEELPENSEVEGVFQSAGQITITDKKTRQEKEVMRYLFRRSDGRKFVVLGRVMLDEAFNDVFDAEGGQDRLQGVNLKIHRGEDSKLAGGRTMGNYEITVYED